jgi:methylmalonyl-CoA epimerase
MLRCIRAISIEPGHRLCLAYEDGSAVGGCRIHGGEAMEVLRLDHIGVVVDDLDAAIERCTELLGLRVTHREQVPEHGVTLAFLPLGETTLELLEYGSGEPPSAIGRFQKAQGHGGTHIAIAVRGLAAHVARLKAQGVPFLGEAPAPGSRGSTICFFDPAVTNGLLTELVEHPAGSAWG